MTISAVELHLLAESMGVQLQRHTGGHPGWYDHHRHIISTRRGQSIGQYKSVLAHELGHAHHGDTPTGNGHFDQRQERRDDAITREIIEPLGDYANEHDIDAIADQLIICDGSGLNPEYSLNPDADFWGTVAANAL